jgi:hypothetical protein
VGDGFPVGTIHIPFPADNFEIRSKGSSSTDRPREYAMRFRTTLVLAAFAAIMMTGTTALCISPVAANAEDPNPQTDKHGRDGTLDNRGGPDAFQYVFMDNVFPDTVSYAWIELRGDSAATWLRGLTDFTSITDGYSRQKLPIGFPFPFYGVTYDCVRVATNGFLQFTTTATWLNNGCLPSTLVAGPMIAVLWDDLHLLRGGRTDTVVVGYRSFGTHMVIEFDQIGFFSCPNVPLKFEAILFPNGDIKLQYNSIQIPTACANSQSIGIQQAGAADSAALNYVCNTTGIQPANGRAILFSRAGGVPNVPSNLTGQYVAPNVVLSWTDPTQDTHGNPITIDSVQVWVGAVGSGTLLATVARGVQSYVEASPINGPRLYYVRAHCSPYYSVAASCSVMVGNPSYFNNFETDDGGWVAVPDFEGWEWGRPTWTPNLTAHSGTKVWGTVLDDNYPNSACFTLTLTPNMRVVSPNASLEFWGTWSTEGNGDGTNFKVSTDHGVTWTLVQPTGGYPNNAGSILSCLSSAVDWGGFGSSVPWTRIIIPIGQFLGQWPMFRFTFGSDSYGQSWGFFVDDVFISGLRAPSSITGTVRAFLTNLPIAGAQVWATDWPDTAVTDSLGYYELSIDPGTYSVTVDHMHYCDTTFAGIVVEEGGQTTCNAVLRHPQVQINRTSIALESFPGVDVLDTFRISNNGGQCPLDFTISDTSEWLSASPASGRLNPYQSLTVTVNVDAPEMVGDYASTLTVSYNALGTPSLIRVDLSIVAAAGERSVIPTEFAYYPNYPNPFNATTALRFDVPQHARVQIVIFNVMGQEVARPVDADYDVGSYCMLFDARNLPSGMYLVRMTATSYTKIGKMMLIK